MSDGKMKHSTTVDVSPALSTVAVRTGSPGGKPAVSDPISLTKSFPLSPIHGKTVTYDGDAVAAMKNKLLTNACAEGDASEAQGYYGFPVGTSEEATPSSADLKYSGAPDISKVNKDANGKALASPYGPNLTPPDSFYPVADNQDSSNPPGSGSDPEPANPGNRDNQADGTDGGNE